MLRRTFLTPENALSEEPPLGFIASECVPFIKSGGLADVLGALPKALAAAGEDIRVVLPKYGEIGEKYRAQMTSLGYFYVNLGWRRQYCGIDTLKLNDITFYFVDNEYYFKRDALYGYFDDAERYAFFSKAVLPPVARARRVGPHADFLLRNS